MSGLAQPELPRLPLVDHLRGLAALSVAWFHLTSGSEGWLRETGRFGWLGVEAFFVISGLVIPYAIMRTFPAYTLRDYPEFIARRMIRLEPPYLVSILIVLVLTLLAAQLPQFAGSTEGLLDPGRIAAHLLYLVPITGHEWLQPVYWTLAFEFAFYLSIGILFPVVAQAGRVVPFVVLSGMCCLAVAVAGIPARICLFVMGLATFRLVILKDQASVYSLVVVACLVAMALAGAWLEGIVGTGLAIFLANHNRIPSPGQWLGVVLGWLGMVSYSLYLIHVPIGGRVVNLGRRFIDTEAEYLALACVALLVSLIAAAILYALVERPSQALSRSFARRWKSLK